MDTKTPDSTRFLIRTMVRGAYDLQKLRIQMGNRLVSNFKVKLGIEPGAKEDELTDTAKQKLLTTLHREYDRITDGVALLDIEGDGIISTEAELTLVGQYVSLLREEQSQFKGLKGIIEPLPLWTNFLKDVKGIGHQLAGVLYSEIDIAKARYPSSLWKFAGLDVGPDGKGRSRRKEHLVEVEYINKAGEEATRVGITFNPFLKTKLMGVLASSFLRSNSPYRVYYDNERNRLENHPDHVDKIKGHKHNMAMRKMIKIFLIDLYKAWRALEGLEVAPPYHVAKLGMRDHS